MAATRAVGRLNLEAHDVGVVAGKEEGDTYGLEQRRRIDDGARGSAFGNDGPVVGEVGVDQLAGQFDAVEGAAGLPSPPCPTPGRESGCAAQTSTCTGRLSSASAPTRANSPRLRAGTITVMGVGHAAVNVGAAHAQAVAVGRRQRDASSLKVTSTPVSVGRLSRAGRSKTTWSTILRRPTPPVRCACLPCRRRRRH